jgi:hypothetical protein
MTEATDYPQLKFRDIDPLQDYYFDGRDYYSVARLVDETKHLEPFDIPLAAINLSDVIWGECNIFDIAFHVKKVQEADLDKPIILDWHGAIADGRHRVIKALANGHTTIKAVRMTWKIEPDRTA